MTHTNPIAFAIASATAESRKKNRKPAPGAQDVDTVLAAISDEEWAESINSKLAKKIGCSLSRVWRYRKKNGKPDCRRMGRVQLKAIPDKVWRATSDTELAGRMGCAVSTVWSFRKKNEKPRYTNGHRWGEYDAALALITDEEWSSESNFSLATQVGCHEGTVSLYRRTQEKPRYFKKQQGYGADLERVTDAEWRSESNFSLADQIGCHAWTVRRYRCTQKKPRYIKGFTKGQYDEALEALTDSDWRLYSNKKLAIKVGCSTATVQRWRNTHGKPDLLR